MWLTAYITDAINDVNLSSCSFSSLISAKGKGEDMEFIANGVNNNYLRNFVNKLRNINVLDEIQEVRAAVSYAWDKPEIFDFCYENSVPLSFYCRYDNSVPVSPHILKWFLGKQDKRIICKLAGDFFHAKVIWAVGYGAYIGSANLTDRAWMNNIEAGILLLEDEIETFNMREQLEIFFVHLENESKSLTEEIISQLEQRQGRFKKICDLINEFENNESKLRIVTYTKSIITVSDKREIQNKMKSEFIEEWNSTLEYLRLIGKIVSSEYRPSWVKVDVPQTTQADQFLHAYYYFHVKESSKASKHLKLHEVNKNAIDKAQQVAMTLWKDTQSPPSTEGRQFYEWGPATFALTRPERLPSLTEQKFIDLCTKLHSFGRHSLHNEV
jgi:phosphatidylserine/phosphatidylglycerophosphate/cardiolipin synthase-like enzyme